MADPQITANKSKALRIGQRLMAGAKSFGKGIRNTVDTSKQVITQSARKINRDQKIINKENKKQERFEDNIRESTERAQIGLTKGAYAVGGVAKTFTEKVLVNPMKAIWQLVLAWAIKNLPTLIDEARKFVKKVRIVLASINRAISSVGKVFNGILSYGKSWLRNMMTFDWKDSKGRLEAAKLEMEDGQNQLADSWDTIYNVWGKDEEELDKLLDFLGSEEASQQAADATTSGLALPQTPAFGEGSRESDSAPASNTGGGGGGTTGSAPMVADTAHPGYKRIYKLAREAGDPFPEVTAAQWASESGYGKTKTGKNNPFGQTGTHPVHGHTRMATPGDPSGGYKNFMNFGSEKEAVEYRVKRWVPEYGDATTPYEALMNIQKHGGNMRYAEGKATAAMPGGDWMEYVRLNTTLIKENNMDPNRKATKAGPPAMPSSSGNSSAVKPATGGGGTISPSGSTTNTNVLRKGNMVGGFVVTSGLGKRVAPTKGASSNHGGIDIGTPQGTYLAFDVDVEILFASGNHGGYGGLIDAWSESLGMQFRCAHMNVIMCSSGQRVRAGTPIGRTGGRKGTRGAGTSTGDHLHFEVSNQKNSTNYGGSRSNSMLAKGAKHLIFSRTKPKPGSKPQNQSLKPASFASNVKDKAGELWSSLSSKRTNGKQNNNNVVLVNQKTYVK